MSDSINSLLRDAIDRHSIVTFDIFDTLLLRCVAEPHDVFKLMEFQLKKEGLAQRRVDAENLARKLLTNERKSEEVSLDDIYAQDGSLTDEIKSLELELESQVLVANPVMKNVYDYCLKNNHRIFIISDMYLPEGFIKHILEREGFGGWDKVYISSECSVTKSTGNLFKLLLNEQHLDPADILHIGDSRHSDAKKSVECGISSFLYEQAFKTLLRTDERINSQWNDCNEFGSKLMLGLLNAHHHFLSPAGYFFSSKNDVKRKKALDANAISLVPHDKGDYWFKFGYEFAGPAVTGFVGWIIEQVQIQHIDKIIFVGRDGYVLKKICDRLAPSLHSIYCFAPRYVNALGVVKDALQNGEEQLSDTIFKTVIDLFIARGWLPNNWHAPYFKNASERLFFIRDNIPNITDHLNLALNEYSDYLKSIEINDFKGSLAIVDSISINLSSQKILTKFLPNANVIGLYWRTPIGPSYSDVSEYPRESFQRSDSELIKDWSLMEWIMTAPYPGVSYIKDKEVIYNESHPNEIVRNKTYPLMEQGMLAFANDFIKLFKTSALLANANFLVHWINEFCLKPTADDRKYFSVIKHASDAASKQWEDCMLSWNYLDQEQPKLPFIKKIVNDTSVSWKFLFITLFTIKKKLGYKRWYVLGIPLLERRVDYNGYTFRLFKLIPFIKMIKE